MEYSYNPADRAKYEAKARDLRAQALRDGVAALRGYFDALFSVSRRQGNAAH